MATPRSTSRRESAPDDGPDASASGAKRRAKKAPAKSRRRPKDLERFVIREVENRDLEGLYHLSKYLNSVNFPHDRTVLRDLIKRSRASFSGKNPDITRRQFMFVMEGLESGRIAGTSMVFAQHGHSEAPHIFYDVTEDERYSSTLDRHFRHLTLRLGFNYDGPSEIGALVLDPTLRAGGLGKPMSFVRFVFMAIYKHLFREKVIAELMPPLSSDGRSRLWEHIGRRFTGLTYQEADKLSHTNKEFIISLFPQTIHASLLPDDVRDIIGQVGEDTKGVKKMLEEVGFEYQWRIDPFDGGPHFEARISDIAVVESTLRKKVAKASLDEEGERNLLVERKPVEGLERKIVAVGNPKAPFKFRAMVAAVRFEGDEVELSAPVKKVLRVKTGANVWVAAL